MAYCLKSLSKKVRAPAKERPPGGVPKAGTGREGGPVVERDGQGGGEAQDAVVGKAGRSERSQRGSSES